MTADRLRASLGDADAEVRRSAVVLLEQSAAEEAGELVLIALGDEDWRVRKEAVRVATALTPKLSLMPDLVAAITQGENVGLRNAALEVLRGLGPGSSDALRRALERAPAHGRKFVVEALGDTGDPAVVPDLAEASEDADPNVAAAAIDALARLGGPGAERALRDRLRAPDPFHRMAALDGLDRLAATVPWEEIAPLLGDRLVRRVALRVLGRTGRTEAVATLVEALGDGSPHVVGTAATSLGRLYAELGGAAAEVARRASVLEPQAKSSLRSLLASDDLPARKAAATLLLLARDSEAVPGIVQLVSEGALGREAVAVLRGWGTDAVPPLLDASSRTAGAAQGVALELAADLVAAPAMLGGAPDPALESRVREAVRHALASPEPAVVRAAVRSLTWFAEPSDAPRLVELAGGADEDVARAAGAVLESLAGRAAEAVRDSLRPVPLEGAAGAALTPVVAQLGGQEAFERLSAALSADDAATRRAAVEALAELGGARAAEHVALALADDDVGVQSAAARALGRIRDEEGRPAGADHLLLALGSDSPAVRAAAARGLGEAGDGRAVEPLRELVREGAPGVAVAAMQALRTMHDPTLGDLLVEALGHDDEEVVKQALRALAESGGERMASRLAVGLTHAAWDVRRLAAVLLGELGSGEAEQALEARFGIEGDDLVREAIEEALGRIRRGA